MYFVIFYDLQMPAAITYTRSAPPTRGSPTQEPHKKLDAGSPMESAHANLNAISVTESYASGNFDEADSRFSPVEQRESEGPEPS